MATTNTSNWYSGWKEVTIIDNSDNKSLYGLVAAIRIDGKFLVIRQGAFPNETITRIKVSKIKTYIVECEEMVER